MEILDKCQTVIVQLPSKSIVYEWLFRIHDFYRPIHTYVSIMLCVLGTVCNFCNIVVLTRKQMRTPVNMILTAMACCDTVVLFSNLIYTTHYTFVAFANCHPKHWSYGWAMFLIAHAHLSLVGHSSSVWLSVMLALIRYLTLRRRGKMNGVQIELRHSYVAIACVIVFVSIMNAPNFLTYKIMEMGLNETCVITDESVRYASAYVPGVSDMAVEADCLVFRMAFWISGTVFKVLPCLLLTILVSLLRRILKEVKANRQRLLRGAATRTASDPTASTTNVASGVALVPFAESARRNSGESILSAAHNAAVPLLLLEEKRTSGGRGSCGTQPPSLPQTPVALTSSNHFASPQTHTALARTSSTKTAVGGTRSGGGRTDRTTRMLLVIVGVFLFTELPQGIMAMLSGMFSEEFRRYIYNNLGDILDLLSLCGACTSFIIYCTMSGQFRNEFRRVFLPTRLKCWMASAIGQSSAGGSGSNCHRYSETYLNHLRSGTGPDVAGGGYGNGAGNSNLSPFLRPLSSMNTSRRNSGGGAADDRRSLTTYGYGGAESMTDVALLGGGMRSTPCSPTPYTNGGCCDYDRTNDEHDTTTRKRDANDHFGGGDGVKMTVIENYDNDMVKFDYQQGATVVKSYDDGTAISHQQQPSTAATTTPNHSTTNGYTNRQKNGYGPPFATVNGTMLKSTVGICMVNNGIIADVSESPKTKTTTTIISNGYYGDGKQQLNNNDNNNNNGGKHRHHRRQADQPIQIEFRI